MAFLCFLAFLATWGLMWRWVVKNRGNWNLFLGNILGAGAGLIVGLVVFSITLSLFAPESKTAARKQVQETAAQEAAAVAAVAAVAAKAEPEPVPVVAPVPAPAPVVVVPPAPAPAPDNFPAFVASKPQNVPSPPESALLPNYRTRLAASLSEKAVQDKYGDAFASVRAQVSTAPGADQSVMASVMCVPFVQKVMRFPASTTISDTAPAAQRFKDQTYTISNTVTARNMLGDDVSYRFDCSMQKIADQDGANAEWRLLDLKLKKSES